MEGNSHVLLSDGSQHFCMHPNYIRGEETVGMVFDSW